MNYSGILDFEDGDALNVAHMIVREDSISINAAATWNTSDRWEIDAIAHKRGMHYISNPTKPKNKGIEGHPAVITLSKITKIEDWILVEGSWSIPGGDYKFSGELELVN